MRYQPEDSLSSSEDSSLESLASAITTLTNSLVRDSVPAPPDPSRIYGRYALLRVLIDDDDVCAVVPPGALRRRTRRNHRQAFMQLLRRYEREAAIVTSSKLRAVAVSQDWEELPAILRRALKYAIICLRLRCAAVARTLRVGNPVATIERCIEDLRLLDRCEVIPLH